MIRIANAADEAFIVAAARSAPGVGARIEADWHLARENPKLPWHFYRVGTTAVLYYNGWLALVAGAVEDSEELCAFLDALRVGFVTSNGWQPKGWAQNPQVLMQRGAGARALPAPELPAGFEQAPPVGEVLQVWESSEAIRPMVVRDGFYSALCTRANHGAALLFGVRQGGVLVATAGAVCITPHEVYISGVETRPEARGQGLASALVQALAHRFAGRLQTLVCTPQLCGFYKKLGFAQGAAAVADFRRPGAAANNKGEEA